MPSKRSFFNAALFKKHLSRFWPLWGGVSLVGALFPLYVQFMLMQMAQKGLQIQAENFELRLTLYSIAAYLVPAFVCAYAILCVMAAWGYLYNARAVGMMHTLPVDRTCLFVTNTLAALAMILIPFAVVGGLISLIAVCWGFFDLIAVVNTVLTVLLITLLFTGIATLCAMLTGHGFVLPVFYLLANFLVFLMEVLLTSLAHEFLIGVPMMENIGRLSVLSPVVKLYNSSFGFVSERLADNTTAYYLTGMWVPALYALAGCAMLALSWMLYKKRHSESAGDVVAFRWLRPVFRYGVALLGGLILGRLLYELMWRELFQKGSYADPLPMAVCLFLGGVIGYYAASMLLEKSLRVFKKGSLPGVGVVAAGAAALCLVVSVDVFGLERKLPAWDEIESVFISDRGSYSGPWLAESDPEQVKELLAFHQAVIEDLDYIRSYVPDWNRETAVYSHYINVSYKLKDGGSLERQYDLWLTEDRVETAGTFENLLSEFYRDPEVCADSVRIPEGAELEDIEVRCSYTESWYTSSTDHGEGEDRETRQIYAALQKDAEEGHISPKEVLQYYESSWGTMDFYLQLYYRNSYLEGGGYYGASKTVYLTPSMKNTIEVLLELGYVTEEAVEQWEADVAQMEAERQ